MNPLSLLSTIGLGINYAQDKINFYKTQAVNEAFNLSQKTVGAERGMFGKGGLIAGEELTPVQMEKDELFVTSDMSILDSKAKDRHEKMEKEEITDIVLPNSFAFSNRKHFRPSDFAEDQLGLGLAYYNEDGDFELEEVEFGDVMGDSKKKMTFSEGIAKIRKHFKTVDEDNKDVDLITKITNQENKQARLPFVNKLIQMHQGVSAGTTSKFTPQQFGLGGAMGTDPRLLEYEQLMSTVRPTVAPVQPLPSLLRPGTPPDGSNLQIIPPNPANLQPDRPTDAYNGIFDAANAELDSMGRQNQASLIRGQVQGAATFGKQSLGNALGAGIQGLGVALQNTNQEVALQDTSLADRMYQETPLAVADQMAAGNFGRANSLISNVASRDPQAASRIAPSAFGSALRQTNQDRAGIISDNLQQRREKYKFINSANLYNRGKMAEKQNATQAAINSKIAGLAGVGTGYLTNEAAIGANKLAYDQQNQGLFDRNAIALANSRRALGISEADFNLRRDDQRERLALMEESLKNRTNTGTTETPSTTARPEVTPPAALGKEPMGPPTTLPETLAPNGLPPIMTPETGLPTDNTQLPGQEIALGGNVLGMMQQRAAGGDTIQPPASIGKLPAGVQGVDPAFNRPSTIGTPTTIPPAVLGKLPAGVKGTDPAFNNPPPVQLPMLPGGEGSLKENFGRLFGEGQGNSLLKPPSSAPNLTGAPTIGKPTVTTPAEVKKIQSQLKGVEPSFSVATSPAKSEIPKPSDIGKVKAGVKGGEPNLNNPPAVQLPGGSLLNTNQNQPNTVGVNTGTTEATPLSATPNEEGIVSPGDGWEYRQGEDGYFYTRKSDSDGDWIKATGKAEEAIMEKIFGLSVAEADGTNPEEKPVAGPPASAAPPVQNQPTGPMGPPVQPTPVDPTNPNNEILGPPASAAPPVQPTPVDPTNPNNEILGPPEPPEPPVIDNPVTSVLDEFEEMEGLAPHVGQDSTNFTMPYGIVAKPDTLKHNGKVLDEDAIANLSESEWAEVDYSNAEHEVLGKTFKRSDYDSDKEYATAVLEEHEKNARKKIPGYDNLSAKAKKVVLSYSWNAGTGGLKYSGFKDAIKEVDKENPSYPKVLEGMTRNAVTVSKGQPNEEKRASKGVIKRRAWEYNTMVPESEHIHSVEQTQDEKGNITYHFYRGDKVVYTKQMPVGMKPTVNEKGEINSLNTRVEIPPYKRTW